MTQDTSRSIPRPARRSEIPAHIQGVARLLFQTRGYARVTMEQIAVEAAVSKRTLYKYFPVKEAILERVLEDELAKDLAQRDFHIDAEAGFRNSVLRLMHESAQWCGQHRDYLLPYIRYKFATFDPGAAGQDKGLLPVWKMLIASAQERRELHVRHSTGQLGTYFHYLYLGALMRWLTEPGLDLRQEFDTVVALFMDGAACLLPDCC